MAVGDICDHIGANDHHQLAQFVSHAAADIDGTRPFWQVSSQLLWFSQTLLKTTDNQFFGYFENLTSFFSQLKMEGSLKPSIYLVRTIITWRVSQWCAQFLHFVLFTISHFITSPMPSLVPPTPFLSSFHS